HQSDEATRDDQGCDDEEDSAIHHIGRDVQEQCQCEARYAPGSVLRNRSMSAISLASIPDAEARLRATGYLPSSEIATSVFLADRLEKPVLVEGPAGVGKTDLARAFAQATGRRLVRLQCYEGL